MLGPVIKAASADMGQSMIRPSRSIVLSPVPATHWFSCFASSVQPHTFWKEGCGLVRRGRDCRALSHHSYTHLADDLRTHLADDIRTIPCRRSSPMIHAPRRWRIIFRNLTPPRQPGRSKTPKRGLVKRRKPQNVASRKMVAAQVSNGENFLQSSSNCKSLGAEHT